MRSKTFYLLNVGAVAVCVCLAADESGKLLPEGPGRDVVAKVCTDCHGAEAYRKLRLDKDGWSEKVGDMVDNGAKANDAEVAAIVDYLAANFGPDSKVRINTAPLTELKSVLGFSVAESEAIIDYRGKNGPFKEPAGLLKVPGVDPQKVEAKKAQMLF
jgi:competence protein ComEA